MWKLEVILGKKDIPHSREGESVVGHDPKSETSRSKTSFDNSLAQAFMQRTGFPSDYRRTVAAIENLVDDRITSV